MAALAGTVKIASEGSIRKIHQCRWWAVYLMLKQLGGVEVGQANLFCNLGVRLARCLLCLQQLPDKILSVCAYCKARRRQGPGITSHVKSL